MDRSIVHSSLVCAHHPALHSQLASPYTTHGRQVCMVQWEFLFAAYNSMI